MDKNEIISKFFTSPAFNKLLNKVDPMDFRDEVKSIVALSLCELPAERIINLYEENNLSRYVFGIVSNQVNSTTSYLYNNFRTGYYRDKISLDIYTSGDDDELSLHEVIADENNFFSVYEDQDTINDRLLYKLKNIIDGFPERIRDLLLMRASGENISAALTKLGMPRYTFYYKTNELIQAIKTAILANGEVDIKEYFDTTRKTKEDGIVFKKRLVESLTKEETAKLRRFLTGYGNLAVHAKNTGINICTLGNIAKTGNSSKENIAAIREKILCRDENEIAREKKFESLALEDAERLRALIKGCRGGLRIYSEMAGIPIATLQRISNHPNPYGTKENITAIREKILKKMSAAA